MTTVHTYGTDANGNDYTTAVYATVRALSITGDTMLGYHRRFLSFGCAVLALLPGLRADDATLLPAPEVAAIPRLPVTTAGIGNTLLRGGSIQGDPPQTYLQLYTSEMAVSADGFVYLTTTWEEGCVPAGIYRAGDALPEHANLGGPSSGEAVAVSDQHVVYAKDGGLDLFDRAPGRGIAPASHRRFALGEPKPAVKSLALDETRGRIYWADGARIRAVRLADGSADPGFAVDLPRATRLAVDHEGALWVMQAAVGAGRELLKAEAFGSEPDAPGHEPARAQVRGDDKAVFIAKDKKNPGLIGLDLGKAQPLVALRFSVSSGDPRFTDLRVQGSVEGREGPWTDLGTFADRPNGWPEEWLHVDPATPWRCVRIIGTALWCKEFEAYGPTPGVAGGIVRFSPDGQRMPQEIREVTTPTAIACDVRNQRLLVADGGPEQQVRAYTELAGKPRLDTSFGVNGRLGAAGGRLGGPASERGRVAPLRFENIRGVGVDAQGNVSVCHVGATGVSQTALESAAPDGKPRWRMEGLAFLDSAAVDPGDESALFSCMNRFRMDWTKPLGGGWAWTASTVDAPRYPEDPRLNGGGALVYGVRRIHGQRFLITTTQWQSPLCVYRFDATAAGETAIPCAAIFPRTSGGAWPPHQPLGFGAFIWRDRNGDGRFQAGEYEKILRDDLEIRAMEFDAAGDLWISGRSYGKNSLHRLPAGAPLGANGVPGWSWASRQTFDIPAPPGQSECDVRGFKVDAVGKVVFLFCFTKELPNKVGWNIPLGRVLMRCRIAGDKLEVTHSLQLPYDCNLSGVDHDQPYSASLAGDTLFVGYMQRMGVLAYRGADLALLGRIDIGSQSQTPIFDGPPELVAAKLKDGYALTMPQYIGNATTLVRWSGATTGWLPAPKLTLTMDGDAPLLKWDAGDAAATGWLLERRRLEPTGWGPWTARAQPAADARSWRDEKVGVSAAAYRIRVLGTGGASDWSQSAYARGLLRAE